MQIYMKDGKALKVKSAGGVLTPKSSSETWAFDNPIYGIADQTDTTFNVQFTSNSQSFSKIHMWLDNSAWLLDYDNVNVASGIYHKESVSFGDEAYRTIILAQPASGDFLTWIERFATKQ